MPGHSLNSERIIEAEVIFDTLNNPAISVKLDNRGAILLEDITRRNIGNPLAIFVGDELITAPMVHQTIAGDTLQITGTYTYQEASNLAEIINNSRSYSNAQMKN